MRPTKQTQKKLLTHTVQVHNLAEELSHLTTHYLKRSTDPIDSLIHAMNEVGMLKSWLHLKKDTLSPEVLTHAVKRLDEISDRIKNISQTTH